MPTRRTFLLAAVGVILLGPILAVAVVQEIAVTLKTPLVGLVDRNHVPPKGYESAVRSVVLQARLADLWPTETGPINWKPLDDLITQAKLAGVTGARLRVTTGKDCPSWLTTQVGTYHVTNTAGATPFSYYCPRWWTPTYTAAHIAFDTLMAARYDSNPFIHEVHVWAVGTTYSAEVAIRELAVPATLTSILAGGYTLAADLKHCYAVVDAMASHWKTTRLITWVPMAWQTVVKGHLHADMAVSQAYAEHVLAAQPGAIIGIDNADQNAYAHDPTYAMVAALHCQRGDQTATWVKLGSSPANLLKTLTDAVKAGVTSMELPSGYTAVPAAALAAAGMK